MSNAEQHRLPGLLQFYWRVVINPYRWQMLSICLLMLGSALLDMCSVGLTVPLLDTLTNSARVSHNPVSVAISQLLRRGGLPAGGNVVTFALLALVSFFFIVRSLFLILYQYWTSAVAHKLHRQMKLFLFERFLSARYEEVSTIARGRVVYHINTPSDAVYAAIMNLALCISGFLTCVFMIGLMLCLSWWVTVIISVMAVVGVYGWRTFADRRARACGQQLFELRGEQSKIEVDAIDGIKVVKAHVLESTMCQREQALLAQELHPTLRLELFKYGPHLVNELLAAGLVLGLSAMTFLMPALGLRFSLLVAFLLATRRIAPTMVNFNASSVELNRLRPSLEVADETLRLLPQERRGGQPLQSGIGAIQLVDLRFSYPTRPEQTVLDGINAVMCTGTVTAIVGSTGSGKSTIAHLLAGLYEPQHGTVLVNGVPLQEYDLSAWRHAIGYVFQDIFVFNASIRENIALWGNVADRDIEWAAGVAQLHEFVLTLPEGYRTVVGDRGLRLSGGQCQRLAIARAIVHRPDVLILDEATSALDTLTESAVYHAINALRAQAIVIVIAHRLSTVKNADHIIVLRSGHVAEWGTHATLMANQGIYASLYDSREIAPAETMTTSR